MSVKNLVIVESPTKSRTISKFLGSDFSVVASMGHIRDLPENRLGVDIKNNFAPEYVSTKSKTVKQIEVLAKGAETVFLATDPDREGEAISWHIREILASTKGVKANYKRVEFHEITRSAISKAFQHAGELNMNLVDAQQARRILDRIVGYQVSPMLWSKIQKNISAGRVQSVALRIVCEREREILAFVPVEYWDFTADLSPESDMSKIFQSKLVLISGKKPSISNVQESDTISLEILKSQNMKVVSSKTEPFRKSAPPPFITSTLQQSAGSYLRFSANRTMQIAQQLYEGVDVGNGETAGLITYMRTDSFTISEEAKKSCKEFIIEVYGNEYVPEKPNFYKNKGSAQEAHEAIRPTDVRKTPESLSAILSREQLNLYKIIWNRFVASQMSRAEFMRTTLDLEPVNTQSGKYTFRTVSSYNTFKGFTVLSSGNDIEEQEEKEIFCDFLKNIKIGDLCRISKLNKEQKFTEPPPRYSEPTLIRELEANGVGRPSTYATTVNTIQQRKYVSKKEGKLIPEELGFRVNDFLVSSLEELFNIGFTAEMENKLDDVESGKLIWTNMLKDFYEVFQKWMDNAKYENSPEDENVKSALSVFEGFNGWEKAEKVGKRTYNDKQFFDSVKKQYEKNGKITEKQGEALTRLIVKYFDPVNEKNFSFLKKFNLLEEALASKKKNEEDLAQREKQKSEVEKDSAEIIEIINSLLEKSESSDGKESSFSEGSFMESLKKQISDGRKLSSKQLYVLKKIAVNKKSELKEYDHVVAVLKITAKDEEQMLSKGNSEKSASPAALEHIKSMITKMSEVKDWKEATGKRSKFSDKNFFSSLKKQFESKNSLSDKQVAALEKLYAKYT